MIVMGAAGVPDQDAEIFHASANVAKGFNVKTLMINGDVLWDNLDLDEILTSVEMTSPGSLPKSHR